MQTHEISIANESDLAFLNNIELAADSIFPTAILPEKVRAETVPQKILAEAIRLDRSSLSGAALCVEGEI